MIHVLHVVFSLELGGTEAFIMNMYRNIDRRKIQFDFLVLIKKDFPYIDEIERMGGHIYWGVCPKYKRPCEFYKTVIPIMKNGKFDIVHSHINNFNGWVMSAAKIAKIPKRISHSHDTAGLDGKGVIKMFHLAEKHLAKNCATHWLACSVEAGAYLFGQKFFCVNGKVVRNGINVDKWLTHDAANEKQLSVEWGLTDGQTVIGNISRFEAKKNQLFLIDVFAEVLKINSNAILLLGGVDGGQLSQCLEKVQQLGIYDRVRFIGPRTDMPNVLHLIDIFVFPSLFEGLGIVLLEAQAAGCYCLASDACPTDSDVGIGTIEYQKLSDSATHWAGRIFSVAFDKGKRKKGPAEIASAFQKKGYDIQSLVSTMTGIYTSEKKK